MIEMNSAKQDEILRVYKDFKSEPNTPYEITQIDREAAALAAEHAESLLRAATVLSAAYNRAIKKKDKKGIDV